MYIYSKSTFFALFYVLSYGYLMGMVWVSYGKHPTLAHEWQLFIFFMDAEGVVFLTEVGDGDGNESDAHL